MTKIAVYICITLLFLTGCQSNELKVPVSKIDSLSLDFESFANGGFLLGHASIVSVPVEYPILEFIEHLFDFAAYESCGKCFPCRLGTKRGHELLKKANTSDYKINQKSKNTYFLS